MDMNKKAKEFALYIKSTDEFKSMNRCKFELEKNKSLKRQLDNYISKKNNLYSNYRIEEASKKVSHLNSDYKDFFNLPLVENYMESTKKFNSMMERVYKVIEQELMK